MRPILWYLAFVGIPALALVGILRLGEQLVPPRAVHGRYSVAVDTSGNNPCLAALLGERELTISQSGPRLDIRLGGGDVSLEGMLVADTIQARGATSCLTTESIGMSATLEKTAAETQLVGQLQFPGCATCAPAPFRASRLASQSRDGVK